MDYDTALVTGGAGFIGSNIVHELVEKGVEVKVLDDFYLGDEKNLEGVENEVEIVDGCVTNPEVVENAVKDVERVFHLAARSSAPMHDSEPTESTRVNVSGFVNVATKAEEADVEKLTFASTSSMYGSVQPPHSTDMPVEPVNLYSASKMSRETYMEAFKRTLEMEVTGLRLFSVYGPREKSKGQFANIISQFIWKMQKGERPKIFGDGTQTRDFSYVGDVVDAFIQASELSSTTDGNYYNVGTGVETNFNEIVEIINDNLGTKVDPHYVENPIDNYVERTKADISKTEKELGWSPNTRLREGVEKTIEFYAD